MRVNDDIENQILIVRIKLTAAAKRNDNAAIKMYTSLLHLLYQLQNITFRIKNIETINSPK